MSWNCSIWLMYLSLEVPWGKTIRICLKENLRGSFGTWKPNRDKGLEEGRAPWGIVGGYCSCAWLGGRQPPGISDWDVLETAQFPPLRVSLRGWML